MKASLVRESHHQRNYYSVEWFSDLRHAQAATVDLALVLLTSAASHMQPAQRRFKDAVRDLNDSIPFAAWCGDHEAQKLPCSSFETLEGNVLVPEKTLQELLWWGNHHQPKAGTEWEWDLPAGAPLGWVPAAWLVRTQLAELGIKAEIPSRVRAEDTSLTTERFPISRSLEALLTGYPMDTAITSSYDFERPGSSGLRQRTSFGDGGRDGDEGTLLDPLQTISQLRALLG